MPQKDLKKLNEKLRRAMNDIQEKEQILLNTNDELQRQRDRLMTIVSEMGEGVIVINGKKEIEMMNARAMGILGYEKEKDIPVGYKKFFVLQLWKELAASKTNIVRKEMKLERPKEMILMVTLASMPFKDADPGFVAVIRDITLDKKIEQMKSDFVANVSHEIRSPMAPMKDALNLVLEGMAGELTEKQRKMLSIVDHNMERLSRMVNDLLDLSKIEAGKMDVVKTKTQMAKLIREVAEEMAASAHRKRIKFKTEIKLAPMKILCDPDKITQVMVNFIHNAIKFTPEEGNISVRLEKYPKDKRYIMISITDSGPGIRVSDMDMLFDRFKQLSGTQRVMGTGLGLSISKAIVELHKGKVFVRSKKGVGSTFSFTLPI